LNGNFVFKLQLGPPTPTVGVDFHRKSIEIQEQQHKIYIWDTTGQDCFRAITKAYLKGTACIFMVYDVTDRNSFMHISQWLTDAKHLCNSSVCLVLVGNKVDLQTKRTVTHDEAYAFAKDNDLLFFETSAKTGEYVEEVFVHSCSFILDQIKQGSLYVEQSNGVWFDVINCFPSHEILTCSKNENIEPIFSQFCSFIGSNICCCCIQDD
jgi:small GTP-binding protein